MTEIKLAKSAGFCFGVKRAVEKVYEQAKRSDGIPVYTYGPIIHNEEVVEDLEKRGVHVLSSEEDLKALKEGIVIIRSHGVPKRIYSLMEELGLTYVDATCPFVLKIHKIVREQSEKGRRIVIIGNATHPEVEGIRGWSSTETVTVRSAEEARALTFPENTRLCVVSQTTFNNNKFKDLVEIIEKKGYDIIVLNTICNATEERQKEAKSISEQVDAMIVIGGKHSSNTQKLFEICKKECENTYYIQTLDDLDMHQFKSMGSVGITAGASTPNNIIQEVHKHVRFNF